MTHFKEDVLDFLFDHEILYLIYVEIEIGDYSLLNVNIKNLFLLTENRHLMMMYCVFKNEVFLKGDTIRCKKHAMNTLYMTTNNKTYTFQS